MKRPQLVFRVRFLSVVVMLGAFLLLGRLYQIQVVQADVYSDKAESQYVHTKSDLYSRGSINFTKRDGETFSAASIQYGYVLAANPTHLTISADSFCEKYKTSLMFQ